MTGVPRRVAVLTAARAEYGLQYPVLQALAAHPALQPLLIVASAHLDVEFGRTIEEIERDGFDIAARIPLPLGSRTPADTTQAIGAGVQGVGRALEELAPDLFIVHGDRFEALAAAVASTQMNVATGHIEGGDLTEGGALDDAVRHAITKLAHLHFTSNADASDRVAKLGEETWRIHTVGLPSIDLIRRRCFADAGEVATRLSIDPMAPLVVFTQHSVATEWDRAADQIRPSLQALDALMNEGAQVVISYPNADAGSREIIRELQMFASDARPLARLRPSLGRHLYHGLLESCARGRGVCAGNSSSGIKETPAFGCPAINIGTRQDRRLRAENVIDVPYDCDAIVDALRCALWDETFRRRAAAATNPYGDGRAGERIAEVLASVELGSRLRQKKMTY